MKFFLLVILLGSFNAFGLDWQGHRGARGLYPENTIGAMEEALKYPVTTLEFDVVISKDNQVVLSHEPWMNPDICLDSERKRFKGRVHNLYKMPYSEIVKFDCGSLPHPKFPEQKNISVGKPLLIDLLNVTEERLKELNRQSVGYNIEIKSTPEDEKKGFQPDIKTFSDIVIKTLKDRLPVEKFTVQSFDWRTLKYIHEAYPEIKLVALLEGTVNADKVIKELGFKPYIISPYFKYLNQADVKAFHNMKIKVVPWTVNEVKDMVTMKKLGVDGIITDYPNRISEVKAIQCKRDENFFENKCVKIPRNAVPSNQNPGWDCRPGFVQKRMKCHKIKVPKNAKLTEDGKDWVCLEGYKRYRSKCVR